MGEANLTVRRTDLMVLHVLISLIILSNWAVDTSTSDICSIHTQCECTETSINCTCSQRYNITLTKSDILLLQRFDTSFWKSEINIQGCGSVVIEEHSVDSTHLLSLSLKNLLSLKIFSYSFKGSTIINLNICNITSFDVEQYGFTNCSIENLEIVNVSAENIPMKSFTNIKGRNLEIRDSYIKIISQEALVANVNNFKMENNIIGLLNHQSILITGNESFIFVRNAIMGSNVSSAFIFKFIEVDIGYSTFRRIDTNAFVTKNITKFSFHDCYAETCKENAFWSVEATRVSFYNNYILVAENDSLFPNFSPSASSVHILHVDGNSFTCDCRLDWIWKEKSSIYKHLLSTSVCLEPEHLAGVTLIHLTLSFDSAGFCNSIVSATELPRYSTRSINDNAVNTTTEISTTVRSEENTTEEYISKNDNTRVYICKGLCFIIILLSVLQFRNVT